MKAIQSKNTGTILMAITLLVVTISSCHRMGQRRTVIVTDNNGGVKRLEYSGTVVFNQQKTGVAYISENGFLKFEHNGQKIAVKSNNKSKVQYAYNGHEGVELDEPGKALLAEAAVAVSAQQAKNKAEQGK